MHHRRYIFVDFDNLRKVKFKKLQKVCDKAFVFIDSAEENIPMALVLYLQRMGKNVKWILVEKPTGLNDSNNYLNFVISFVMGSLHQKLDKMVEFAMLSNDQSFDALVNYITASGRSCIRVKREKPSLDQNLDTQPDTTPATFQPAVNIEAGNGFNPFSNSFASFVEENGGVALDVDTDWVGKAAEDTITRLVRSGNRPSSIHLLKDYILLNSHSLAAETSDVEQVIKKLVSAKEINVNNDEVIYNF